MAFPTEFNQLISSAQSNTRLRLAPTPSGFLHLGNAVNFMLNWLAARAAPNGRLLLRIDDLDAERKRPEYLEDIFQTLEWLGLDWDEGPVSVSDFEKNWSQSLRLDMYQEMLSQLTRFAAVYACSLSRKELAAIQGDFPDSVRRSGLPLDTPDTAWRIVTPPGFDLPDFVVRRRDGIPAYQIASLADDIFFGVTHAIRGVDLHPSSLAQFWLLQQLRWDHYVHIQFIHHPLILDENGQKQSKTAGSAALATWRQHGKGPHHVYRSVASMLKLPQLHFESPNELLTCIQSVTV